MRSELQDSFYNYIVLYATSMGGAALSIVISALVARALGPEKLGTYNLFKSALTFLMIFGSGWVVMSLLRFGREEFVKEGVIRKAFWGMALYIGIGSLLSGLAVLLFKSAILDYIGSEDQSVIVLILLSLLLVPLPQIFSIAMQAVGEIKQYALVPFLQKAFFALFTVGLWFFYRTGLQVHIIIILSLVGSLLALGQAPLKLKREWIWPPSTSREMLGRMFAWSSSSIPGAISQYILSWADTVFVGVLMTAYAVGIYSISSQMFFQFLLFIQLISSLVTPMVISYRVQGKQEQIDYYLNRLTPQLALIVALTTCGVLLFSKALILALYGEEYASTLTPFIILFSSSAFYGISVLYGPVMGAFDYVWISVAQSILTGGLNVLLNYLLIRSYGTNGVALATGLANFALALVRVGFIAYKFKTKVHPILLSTLPLLAMGAVCLLTDDFLNRAIWLVALFGVSVLAVKLFGLVGEKEIYLLEIVNMPVPLKKLAIKTAYILSSPEMPRQEGVL